MLIPYCKQDRNLRLFEGERCVPNVFPTDPLGWLVVFKVLEVAKYYGV